MSSPFPGTDPYLESPAFWSDFHSRFVNAWCEAIADSLPDEYEASLNESVYLVEHDPDRRLLTFPDVAMTHDELRSSGSARDVEADIVTLEPVTIPLTILDGPREAHIEIVHHPDRSLVAVLELLSPANKVSPNRTQYLAKRQAILEQEVHLVELDLLLGDRRLPMDRPLPPADYYYIVSRAELRPDAQVYSWSLPQPLPCLPIPLRGTDPDLRINLGEVFATTYTRGRFARRLDYRAPCSAPLTAEQRIWVESHMT